MTMLSEQHHGRIIRDAKNIARIANIPENMLDESATKYCSEVELDWLRNYRMMKRDGKGLVLIGHHKPPPETKMMAMTAALLRNYVDARVITVQGLLDAHENGGELPDPTVLFIPNLFVRQGGKGLPSWKMQIIYDLLLHRFTEGKVSSVYVENMDAMGAEFGQVLSQHLAAHYVISIG